MKELLESIKANEGFRSKPYYCTNQVLTIGYGFSVEYLELDQEMCDQILEKKVKKLVDQVNKKWDWVEHLPKKAQHVLYEMVYQLGLNSVSKFKLTLGHLKNHEFLLASEEMLDSKWAKSDSPDRASRMSAVIASLHVNR